MPDPLYYLLILPGFIFGIIAAFLIKSSTQKYQEQRNLRNLNGLDVASKLGKAMDVNFKVELSDSHAKGLYNPRHNLLEIPRTVGLDATIYSMAFAAHELGAIAQANDKPITFAVSRFLRGNLDFTTRLGYFFIFAGFIVQYGLLSWIGIGFFVLSTMMALLSIPFSRFASANALALLIREELVFKDEAFEVEDMLGTLDLSAVAKLGGTFSHIFKV